MRIRFKLLLMSELVLLGATLALLVPIRTQMRRQVIDDLQSQLRAIAVTAALQLDGDLVSRVRSGADAKGSAFGVLRDQLRAIRDGNGLSERNIYTFYRDGDQVRFGVMTHEVPFVGDAYPLNPEMREVFEHGKVVVRDLYEDEHGEWISAYAPIRDSAGNVAGLLEVDHQADEYFRRYRTVTLVTIALGMVVLAFSSLLGWYALDRTVLRPMRSIYRGMVALGRRDFRHRVHLETKDEFQELADTLNSISEQLDVARLIQTGFFPKSFPNDPRYRIAGVSTPCDATGGDYYDVFKLSGGELALVVADVSGHGLGASLLMSACRSVFRALADADVRPGELIDRLDALLEHDLNDGRFITMIYGVLSPDGTFTYSNAGHGPALVRTAEGVRHLGPHRTPLGIRIDLPAEDLETTLRLEPGSRIFFASDGVTETLSADGKWFGNERLEPIVSEECTTAAEVLQLLHDALARHGAGQPATDDVTIVCVDLLETE